MILYLELIKLRVNKSFSSIVGQFSGLYHMSKSSFRVTKSAIIKSSLFTKNIKNSKKYWNNAYNEEKRNTKKEADEQRRQFDQ